MHKGIALSLLRGELLNCGVFFPPGKALELLTVQSFFVLRGLQRFLRFISRGKAALYHREFLAECFEIGGVWAYIILVL
jgi:hypothetical protein